jgi:hypothetical protein
MNDILDKKALPKEEQAVLDRFLADNSKKAWTCTRCITSAG